MRDGARWIVTLAVTVERNRPTQRIFYRVGKRAKKGR